MKSYYQSAEKLKQAYPKDHFNVLLNIIKETISDEVLPKFKKLKSDIETRRFIVAVLDSINSQRRKNSLC
ncbi:MAG: hypothetical protein A2X18_12490 [Bacteroidetes bacterium GWF2_40_14]|nr:MAG: hypothetical protein A2X18_12490 [Bacteroidetes bacterium GWF2_40_14]